MSDNDYYDGNNDIFIGLVGDYNDDNDSEHKYGCMKCKR